MKKMHLGIELLEDLHIGTGTGLGDIDALQVRDRSGAPVLPASHLKGLLREAAVEWHRFDPQAITKPQIERLFGRAGSGQGQLQLSSAYLSNQGSNKVLLWGSTAIGPNGIAEEKSLRFVEHVAAGSRFSLQATLHTNDQDSQKLLEAIIARCRRLGSGRNRGSGLVRWHREKSSVHAPQISSQTPSQYPARLRLLLRNLDPVCLASTGHPGNLIGSESFIRGRSLRGAFAAACLARQQTDKAQGLLADTLSWGDALPLPITDMGDIRLAGCEVLPIALSIGTPKTQAAHTQVPGWVFGHTDDVLGSRGEIDQACLKEGERPAEKLKRPAAGEFVFRASADKPWRRYRPQILERLHTRVPSEDNQHEQALFSTEEVAEKTLFVSDLIVSTPEQAKLLMDVLRSQHDGWLRIGRGGKPLQIEASTWLPAPPAAEPTPAEGFTLLLESDLIARNAAGNFQDRLNLNTLADLCGLASDALQSVQLLQSFSEGGDLYGFNASTGLPRLAQRAIKAGSVVRISGAGASRLQQALSQRLTLGECPEEGFGRFRLNRLPTPTQPTPTPSAPQPSIGLDETQCREARRWVDRFGNALAADSPSASQWGDFRSRIQAARTPAELQAVFDAIKSASDRHGGRAWQKWVKLPSYQTFIDELKRLPLADAQARLDYILRWQRALKAPKPQQQPEAQA